MIIYRFILRSLGGPVKSSLRTSSRLPPLFLNVSDVLETAESFLTGVYLTELDGSGCGGGGRGGGGGGGTNFSVVTLFSAK